MQLLKDSAAGTDAAAHTMSSQADKNMYPSGACEPAEACAEQAVVDTEEEDETMIVVQDRPPEEEEHAAVDAEEVQVLLGIGGPTSPVRQPDIAPLDSGQAGQGWARLKSAIREPATFATVPFWETRSDRRRTMTWRDEERPGNDLEDIQVYIKDNHGQVRVLWVALLSNSSGSCEFTLGDLLQAPCCPRITMSFAVLLLVCAGVIVSVVFMSAKE